MLVSDVFVHDSVNDIATCEMRFISAATSPKASQIDKNRHNASINIQTNNMYIAVNGRATISTDR